MSHLVHGDDPDHPLNDVQAQRLTEMVATARDRGLRFDVVHLSNSPAVLTRPDLAFDMVRPGIAVYGQTPLPERGDMGLRPAMTVTCPVVMVRALEAGDGVSYGHTWVAERDTTVALIPAGYADGVFRTLIKPLRGRHQRQALPERGPHLHGPVRGRSRTRPA